MQVQFYPRAVARFGVMAALALGAFATQAQQSLLSRRSALAPANERLETYPSSVAPSTQSGPSRYRTAATIFSEGFTNGIPSTWTLHNDANTPNSAIAALAVAQRAWDTLVDPTQGRVAAAISWFSVTAGVADRWLVTPGINLPTGSLYRLKWKAKGQDADFRDGYQVKINTTSAAKADFPATYLFSIPDPGPATSTTTPATQGENSTWTERSVILPQSVVGQTVYIAFINNSVDMFMVRIDDIEIESVPDNALNVLSAAAVPADYVAYPRSQAVNIRLGATLTNTGANNLTAAKLKINKVRGAGTYNDSVNFNLNTGVTSTVSIPNGFTAPDTGLYLFNVAVQAPATVTFDAGSDLTDTIGFNVLDSTYFRDNGRLTGSIGWPSTIARGGDFANFYQVFVADTLSSVTAILRNVGGTGAIAIGDTVFVNVFNILPSSGLPTNTPIASGFLRLTGATGSRVVTVAIPNGVVLAAGNYAIGIRQSNNRSMTIGTNDNFFIPRRAFGRAATATTWSFVENVGASTVFAIYPNFGKASITTSLSNVLNKDFGIKLYPNPSRGEAMLSLSLNEAASVSVRVNNLLGQEVKRESYGTLSAQLHDLPLNLRSLTSGIYLVSVQVNGQQAQTMRLVID